MVKFAEQLDKEEGTQPKPAPKTGESEQTEAQRKQMMSAFGADLHALCEEGMDYDQAVQECFATNVFGVMRGECLEEDADPCPAFMLKHEEDDPDLQASSKVGQNHNLALIKRHMSFLNSFSEADLQAALDDMDMDPD
jgi:hypothetical protein